MAKAERNQPLTLNRMSEIDQWSKAFSFFGWCLLPCILLALQSICSAIMWRLGQWAQSGAFTDQSVEHSLWRTAPAVFYGVVSLSCSIAVVRFIVTRLWPQAKLFRPWANPVAALFDFAKLGLAVALSTALCFYATYIIQARWPAAPKFLKPPSQLETRDQTQMIANWWMTRGVQFVFVVVIALLLVQYVYGFRLNRNTILPRRLRIPIVAGYILLFEALYSISQNILSFLFYAPFEQGRTMVLISAQFLGTLLIFIVLLAVVMSVISRRIAKAEFPIECQVVLAGITGSGKTRFFGEALVAASSMELHQFCLTVEGVTESFLKEYTNQRRQWKLAGTVRPQLYDFSLERVEEVIWFHWQDIQGGIPIGSETNEQHVNAWRQHLKKANALCIFVDCLRMEDKPLSEYPDFRALRRIPFLFIREMKQLGDFERPPIICIVATQVDRVKPAVARRIRRRLQAFADDCKSLIAQAELPRGYVSVRMTSAMANMRHTDPPDDVTGKTPLPKDPQQQNCGETLMWVASKIIEAKFLGLEGVSAALFGRGTDFGELQLDLEEFAGKL